MTNEEIKLLKNFIAWQSLPFVDNLFTHEDEIIKKFDKWLKLNIGSDNRMTNEEAISNINELKIDVKVHTVPHVADIINESLDMAIKALKQTDKVEESNFSTEQYKADLQGAYDCGYACGYNCGYADAMLSESED